MSDPAPGATVLVVEDDRALRESLVESLRANGFGVAAAGDGARAVEMLRGDRFDVVLLDIGLPFVDGWHVLQTVTQPVPAVVVISARGSERDKVRALDAGADDYLAKPFGTGELLARVRAVLRRVRPPLAPPRVVSAGGVTVDLGAHTVFRDGEEGAPGAAPLGPWPAAPRCRTAWPGSRRRRRRAPGPCLVRCPAPR